MHMAIDSFKLLKEEYYEFNYCSDMMMKNKIKIDLTVYVKVAYTECVVCRLECELYE